jgi:hypothetical protein
MYPKHVPWPWSRTPDTLCVAYWTNYTSPALGTLRTHDWQLGLRICGVP